MQKKYFDRYVHAINQHEGHQGNIKIGYNVDAHPSVNDIEQIFQSYPMVDYEYFLNYVMLLGILHLLRIEVVPLV